jgi:hypothetical protein
LAEAPNETNGKRRSSFFEQCAAPTSGKRQRLSAGGSRNPPAPSAGTAPAPAHDAKRRKIEKTNGYEATSYRFLIMEADSKLLPAACELPIFIKVL